MFQHIKSIFCRHQKPQPLVSVIVTSYNYGRYLGMALDSLLNQSYRNFEILVVDDGSTDNSSEIVSEYAKKYSCIKLYTHPNGVNMGIIASIRLGISKAKGDYVAFCESDDYWAADHLGKVVEVIQNNNNVIIVANGVKLIGDEECIHSREWYIELIKAKLKKGKNRINLHKHQERNYIPTFSAVTIKKDVLTSLDYETPIPAWIDFWLYRQILIEHPLYYVNEDLTFWRQQPKSYNGASKEVTFEDSLRVFIPASNRLIGIK